MHMNRRIPAKGEDPAAFLAETVLDALRDARDAGLSSDEAHVLMSNIARQCDPMGLHRVWASPATREQLLALVKLRGSIGWEAALALNPPSDNAHVEMHRRRAAENCAEFLATHR